MIFYEKHMMRRLNLGFTLIELMIVVAIIGILTSIAYPSYQGSIMKSRRVDAQGALMGLANAMERYYTVNNFYPSPSSSAPTAGIYPQYSPVDSIVPPIPDDGSTPPYYNLLIYASSASSYTLQAQPRGVITDLLGTLSLDHAGNRQCIKVTVITPNCW